MLNLNVTIKVKQENQWGSSGEAISVDPWTTWLVLNSAQNLFVILQFLKQMLQLFEGECVPDIEKLKLELLKEEVGCVEYNCGLPTPQKITI